jgi:hypothetical protein
MRHSRILFFSIHYIDDAAFARLLDIEKHPKSNTIRTNSYFAHPYASFEQETPINPRRFFLNVTNFNNLLLVEIQCIIRLSNDIKKCYQLAFRTTPVQTPYSFIIYSIHSGFLFSTCNPAFFN